MLCVCVCKMKRSSEQPLESNLEFFFFSFASFHFIPRSSELVSIDFDLLVAWVTQCNFSNEKEKKNLLRIKRKLFIRWISLAGVKPTKTHVNRFILLKITEKFLRLWSEILFKSQFFFMNNWRSTADTQKVSKQTRNEFFNKFHEFSVMATIFSLLFYTEKRFYTSICVQTTKIWQSIFFHKCVHEYWTKE